MDPVLKKAGAYTLVALAGAALLFVCISLYEKGYRFNGLRFSSPALVVLSTYPEGAILRVGEREIDVTPKNGEVRLPLEATLQQIVVSKEGYWPWNKEISLQGGTEMRFSVFLFKKSPEGAAVQERTPERRELEALFKQQTSLPTRKTPVRSDDSSAELFVENGKILARWLSKDPAPQYYCIDGSCDEHVALSFEAELRDLSFLPSRNDVALLAIQNGVFALELDNRGTQNFQPVYRGTRPRFIVKDGVPYIKDGLALVSLSLHE